MSLLAGVLKFNQTLKTITLSNTGLDDASGAFFATALLENKTLENIDISANPLLGSTGITEIARYTLARAAPIGRARAAHRGSVAG